MGTLRGISMRAVRESSALRGRAFAKRSTSRAASESTRVNATEEHRPMRACCYKPALGLSANERTRDAFPYVCFGD
jgi:hypothetical protein